MRREPAITSLVRDLTGKDLELVKNLARKDVDFVKVLVRKDVDSLKDLVRAGRAGDLASEEMERVKNLPNKVDLLRIRRSRERKRRTRLLIALALLSGFAVLGAVAFVLLRGRCPFLKPGKQTSPPDSTLQSFTPTPEKRRAANLLDIKGIDPAHAQKLEAIGLKTTDDLLSAGASPKDREGLAAAVGVSGQVILRWVNMADLRRIRGVGEEYSDLLEAAGVDTVPELAQRRADNLTQKMAVVNEGGRFVRRLPTESQVAAWIENARSLPRLVTY